MDDKWRRVEEIEKSKKYFVCRSFGHITCNCKNVESKREEGSTLMPLNKFKLLKGRVINIGEESEKKIGKNRKTILREERLRKGKPMEI